MIKHCVEPVRAADSCWLVIMRTSFHTRGVMQSSLNMRKLIIATYRDKNILCQGSTCFQCLGKINLFGVMGELNVTRSSEWSSLTPPGLKNKIKLNETQKPFYVIDRIAPICAPAATMILTWVAVNLILRNDDLTGVGVIGVLDGVAEDADHTDHLTRLADAVRDVAGVTDELLTTSHLQQGRDRNVLAAFLNTNKLNDIVKYAFFSVPLPQTSLQQHGHLPSLSHPRACSACRFLRRLHSIYNDKWIQTVKPRSRFVLLYL